MGKAPVTFFLSRPRSRTAWLALYLTGLGIHCFHELWRTCSTIEEVARVITAQQAGGPVANADAANWFFLDELQEAFPEAQFIELYRPDVDVAASLRHTYGEGHYEALLEAYARVESATTLSQRTVVLYDGWTPEVSRRVYELANANWYQPGWTTDQVAWHERLHQVRVSITDERATTDLWMGETGQLQHMQQKVGQYLGGSLWAL